MTYKFLFEGGIERTFTNVSNYIKADGLITFHGTETPPGTTEQLHEIDASRVIHISKPLPTAPATDPK